MLFDMTGTLYDAATGTAYPDARPALAAVLDMGLRVAVVSNHGQEETEATAEIIGLYPEIVPLLAAESVGAAKPDPRIFLAACAAVECAPEETLMVGDDVVADVLGALRAGLHAAWLNRAGDESIEEVLGVAASPAPTIRTLAALRTVLG